MRSILDKKLKERDEFIEQNMGGEDMLRGTRDDIIRSLPDLKAVTAAKPQTTVSLDEDNSAPVANTPDNPFTGGDTPGAPAAKEVPAGTGGVAAPTPPGMDIPPPPAPTMP